MSISSSKLQSITEKNIGLKSKYMFGWDWKIMYEFISKEYDLDEKTYEELLSDCNFKHPEKIGFIALLCPVLCTYITDRVLSNKIKGFYKFMLYVWYFLLIDEILRSIFEWRVSSHMPSYILFLVIISWSFRYWCKMYNKIELVYHILKKSGKL